VRVLQLLDGVGVTEADDDGVRNCHLPARAG
jgi:hypothetical protein